MTYRLGSLCSGYGGLEMGLRLAGWPIDLAFVADNDPAAAAVLAHHHPDAPNLGDITSANWAAVERVDILAAGYPCPPFSISGPRRGEDDDRYIWPNVFDAIRHLRPGVVLLENVAGHLSLGFGRVLGDLATIGYDTVWVCLPASVAGAPQGRPRVFVAAHPHGEGWRIARCAAAGPGGRLRRRSALERGAGQAAPGAGPFDWFEFTAAIRRWERVLGRAVPTPVCVNGPRGGLRPNARTYEWAMGLPAGHVTDVPGVSNDEAVRILGNGVVPQQSAVAVTHLAAIAAAQAVEVAA